MVIDWLGEGKTTQQAKIQDSIPQLDCQKCNNTKTAKICASLFFNSTRLELLYLIHTNTAPYNQTTCTLSLCACISENTNLPIGIIYKCFACWTDQLHVFTGVFYSWICLADKKWLHLETDSFSLTYTLLFFKYFYIMVAQMMDEPWTSFGANH